MGIKTLTSISSRHMGERGGDDESVKSTSFTMESFSAFHVPVFQRDQKGWHLFFPERRFSRRFTHAAPRFPYLPGWSSLAHVNTTSLSFPSSSPFPSIRSINRRSRHSVFFFHFNLNVTSHFISSRSFLSYSGKSKVHLSILLSYSI